MDNILNIVIKCWELCCVLLIAVFLIFGSSCTTYSATSTAEISKTLESYAPTVKVVKSDGTEREMEVTKVTKIALTGIYSVGDSSVFTKISLSDIKSLLIKSDTRFKKKSEKVRDGVLTAVGVAVVIAACLYSLSNDDDDDRVSLR